MRPLVEQGPEYIVEEELFKHLFQSDEGHLSLQVEDFPLPGQFIVHFPGAEDDSLHLLGVFTRWALVGNQPLEPGPWTHPRG